MLSSGMATRFVVVDRDTPMLLPPDLREWVPEGDMVHFVIEAVEGMSLPTLAVNRRGTGSAQFPPKMMLAMLIYCYAHGLFSSRKIEGATYRDVAVRYLTGDTHPDHDTICKFRGENFAAVHGAFVEVLKLARSMGVLKVGTVSVDGTHIRASASKDRNVRYDRAGELEEQLELDVSELLKKAESADASGSDDGESLPREIARREKLKAKMQAARAELEARAKNRAQAERAEYERKVKDREDRDGSHKGPTPKPPSDTPEPNEQANLTDADSRLMRKSNRSSYEQCYNAQAVVDADGSQLIVGGHVSQCSSDANEMEAALASVPEEAGPVTAVLADCGYVNAEAIERVQAPDPQDGSKVEVYVAVSRVENHDQRRYDYRPKSATDKPARTIKDPRLLAMREKLRTPEGRRLYAKRRQTVEPVFGIIKSVMGCRQFLLRGLAKVNGEWSLLCLAYNVKRLWALKTA